MYTAKKMTKLLIIQILSPMTLKSYTLKKILTNQEFPHIKEFISIKFMLKLKFTVFLNFKIERNSCQSDGTYNKRSTLLTHQKHRDHLLKFIM